MKKLKKRLLPVTSLALVALIIWSITFSESFDTLVSRTTDFIASVLPSVLTDLTNASREKELLKDLKVNSKLEEAARLKAHDMATKGYFAHTSPEGLNPWYWIKKVNYDFIYAGENLAVNFDDSTDVSNAWMNSPKHRENILSGNFTEIGIATEQGMYNGKLTTFVVQMFGTQKKTINSSTTKVITLKSPIVKEKKVAENILKDSTSPSKTQDFLSVTNTENSPIVAGEQVAESTVSDPKNIDKEDKNFLIKLFSFIKNLF